MKSLVPCLFLIVLLSTSTLALYGSNSKVQMLTQANFNQKVIQDQEGLWLVEFFAPWCGHCKSLAPEWEKAAKALSGFVNVAAVDMTTDQSVGQPYNIQGFPTLKFFGQNKQSPTDYSGGRTAQAIIDYAFDQAKQTAMKRIGAKSSSGGSSKSGSSGSSGGSGGDANDKDVIVLTDQNFDEVVYNSKDAWFIEFYAPWCGHCKSLAPTWAKLATAMKDTDIRIAKVDATENPTIAQRLGVSGYPTLKFFPNSPRSDSEAIDHNGGRDLSSLEEWAKQQRDQQKPIQFKQLINQEIFDEFCTNFKGVCVVAFFPHIYDSTAAERNDYTSIIERVASEQKGKPFSFLWSEGGAQLDFETTFAVGGSGYPCVLAISHSKKVSSVMRSAFTEPNLKDFVKNLVAGKGSFSPFRQEVPKIKKQDLWDGLDKKPATPTDDL